MAVKVMWARAVRAEQPAAAEAKEISPVVAPAAAKVPAVRAAPAAKGPAEEKPKRRRSSVYDADGNEVFLTLMCLKCHKMRPLSQFGLRKMADGAIRNQPWCKACRAESSSKALRKPRQEPAETGESPVPAEPSVQEAPQNENLAAQIAAALHAGRR